MRMQREISSLVKKQAAADIVLQPVFCGAKYEINDSMHRSRNKFLHVKAKNLLFLKDIKK